MNYFAFFIPITDRKRRSRSHTRRCQPRSFEDAGNGRGCQREYSSCRSQGQPGCQRRNCATWAQNDFSGKDSFTTANNHARSSIQRCDDDGCVTLMAILYALFWKFVIILKIAYFYGSYSKMLSFSVFCKLQTVKEKIGLAWIHLNKNLYKSRTHICDIVHWGKMILATSYRQNLYKK